MISANDLKVKGIKAIETELADKEEAVITLRGKPKFVVIDIERYDEIRAYELDLVYEEIKKEIKEGRAKRIKSEEELEKHIENL